MDRPPTSKPRGTCKYYTHPRGCFAGNNCKFLHGEDATLTPFDAAKVCKYYRQGFCKNGENCWFLHELPDTVKSTSSQSEDSTGGGETEEICGICLEKPTTYGLLGGCSHIFCIACLRSWRDPAGKTGDVVVSGNTKKCPMCRVQSRFITPSSQFFPLGHVGREKAIDNYRASMGRIRCRYFDTSMVIHPDRPKCPFGRSCFYKHLNLDGTPHVLSNAAGGSQRRHNRNSNIGSLDLPANLPAEVIQNIMGNNPLEEISATIDAIRESLPVLENNLERSRTDQAERDAMVLNVTHLERLADQMLITLSAMRISDEDSNASTQTGSVGVARTHREDDTPRATIPPALTLVEPSDGNSGETPTGHWSVANALANLTLDITYRLSEVQRVRETVRDAQSAVNRIAESLGSSETANVEPRQEIEELHFPSLNDTTDYVEDSPWDDVENPSWSFGSVLPTEGSGSDVPDWPYAGSSGWSSPAILARDSVGWNTGPGSPVPSIVDSEEQIRTPWTPYSFQLTESDDDVRSSTSTPLAASTSRFSTVVGREAERFIIDLDDDDVDEVSGQDDSVEAVCTMGSETPSAIETILPPEDVAQESSISIPSTSKPPSRVGSPTVGFVRSCTFVSPSESVAIVTTPPAPTSEEPPFATDGRGRVVWSSTSNAGREGTRGRRNKSKSKRPAVSEASSGVDCVRPSNGSVAEGASSASESPSGTD